MPLILPGDDTWNPAMHRVYPMDDTLAPSVKKDEMHTILDKVGDFVKDTIGMTSLIVIGVLCIIGCIWRCCRYYLCRPDQYSEQNVENRPLVQDQRRRGRRKRRTRNRP